MQEGAANLVKWEPAGRTVSPFVSATLALGLAVFISVSFGSAALGADRDLDFHQVLSRYKSATALPGRISFQAVDEIEVRATEAPLVTRQRNRVEFLKEIDRFDVLQEIFIVEAAPEVEISPRAPYLLVRTVVTDMAAMRYQARNGSPSHVRIFDDRRPAVQEAMWLLTVGRILEGFTAVNGSKQHPAGHIADVMASGSDSSIKREIDGDGVVYTLSAATRYGRHVLVVDSRRNFLPGRIEIHKQPGDFLFHEPLDRQIASHVTIWDQMETTHVGGVIVPTSVRETRTTTFKSGAAETIITLHRRSAISLNPILPEDAFAISIPDGTPVVREDQSGLEYEWRGGQAVPAVDHAIADGIDATLGPVDPFPRKHHRGRLWPWILGAGAVAVVALVVWVVSFKKNVPPLRGGG